MSIAEESSERIMSIIKKISGRIPNFLRLRLPRKTSLLRKPPRIMVARRQSHTETPNILLKAKIGTFPKLPTIRRLNLRRI